MSDPCLCGYWQDENMSKGLGKSVRAGRVSTKHGYHYWHPKDGPCRPAQIGEQDG